ncbi:MAG: tRNA (adenosine(37)-N6)-threonylcarbamoyltransferase complex ATPase subunit type 1 TsaE [Flavobacteriales bacterium]
MLQTLTVPTPDSSSLVSDAVKLLMRDHQVFCFHGELGAGKTTFIKAICRDLGVKSDTSSPSFSIVNEYELADSSVLYHFDLYRLKNPVELMDIGWEDYLYSNHPILVEWPEMAEGLIPDDAVHLFIEAMQDGSRSITIKQPTS